MNRVSCYLFSICLREDMRCSSARCCRAVTYNDIDNLSVLKPSVVMYAE